MIDGYFSAMAKESTVQGFSAVSLNACHLQFVPCFWPVLWAGGSFELWPPPLAAEWPDPIRRLMNRCCRLSAGCLPALFGSRRRSGYLLSW